MKTSVFSASTAAISLVCAVMVLPSQLSAKSEQAATIIKDGGCIGFIPTASGTMGTLIVTADEARVVGTKEGVVSLVCHFDIPAGLEPVVATRAEGFLCGTFFGLTTESKMVATPGGRATLICMTNPGN